MRAWLLLIPAMAMAQEVPAGTEIAIRLTSSISTRNSHAADPVDAVVIAPVVLNGRTAIAAGAIVHGKVEKIAQPQPPDRRATLLLIFHRIETSGTKHSMSAQLFEVDNAREKVDSQGQIVGILASETISGQLDAGLDKLSDQYSGLASILSAAKSAVLPDTSIEIDYPRGVEMTLRLNRPLPVPFAVASNPPAWPVDDRSTLEHLIAREPFQTTAEHPPQPSDLTNLLLVASEEALRRAFADAGWSGAARLEPFSKLETLRALAADRGYREAPVSVLLLDGKPPDFVFEKSNDTFARRHHLRIWRRPGVIAGKPIWAVAATHDTGIDFSQDDRTFIHRIDPRIDREREKVVDDLLFTGRVKAVELLDRPQVPHLASNATGDRIETDGRVAALLLQ